nr:hypothetical protein [Candidatus Dormibacteraeota bacterium]
MPAGTNNRRRILVASTAGLIALGAFAVLFNQFHTATSVNSPGSVAPATSKAVVALVDIGAGDRLTAANTTVVEYPTAALPPGAVYFTTTGTLLAATWY